MIYIVAIGIFEYDYKTAGRGVVGGVMERSKGAGEGGRKET